MKQFSFAIRFLLAILVCNTLNADAQTERQVKIMVTPNHADWLYKKGEEATFEVTVFKSNVPLANAKIYYEIGLEKMPSNKKDSMVLTTGKTILKAGTLKEPGFLRCTVTSAVDNITYRGLATAGFEPYTIKPYTEMPADFTTFWETAKMELAKIPLDARMTLMPERCTEKTNVYHVNIQGYGNNPSRLYGVLCVPKKEGKYPALLKVPGAGVRPYGGDIGLAEKGVITLEIGIHGVPVNLEPQLYTSLATGALLSYPNINLDDKDRFYYKRVYLNCIRANDFLTSLPQYDGSQLSVMGGSQGGALSIVTAALDPRVKFMSAMYPALSDLTASLHGRASGWPNYFDKWNNAFDISPIRLLPWVITMW